MWCKLNRCLCDDELSSMLDFLSQDLGDVTGIIDLPLATCPARHSSVVDDRPTNPSSTILILGRLSPPNILGRG